MPRIRSFAKMNLRVEPSWRNDGRRANRCCQLAKADGNPGTRRRKESLACEGLPLNRAAVVILDRHFSHASSCEQDRRADLSGTAQFTAIHRALDFIVDPHFEELHRVRAPGTPPR